MMRRATLGALAGLAVAACGSSGRAPAWPERQEPETDGGESLEPRTAAASVELGGGLIASILEELGTPEPAAATSAPAVEVSVPAVAPGTDEVLTTEEIIIEISDDDDE